MKSPKVTLQFEFEDQEQPFSQEALVDLVQNVRRAIALELDKGEGISPELIEGWTESFEVRCGNIYARWCWGTPIDGNDDIYVNQHPIDAQAESLQQFALRFLAANWHDAIDGWNDEEVKERFGCLPTEDQILALAEEIK